MVITPLYADVVVPVLPKIQGNLAGFVVEVEHSMVEDSLLEDKSMKQQRFLKPSNEKSDLDIVRLMEAYGLSNISPQTSLKRRVQVVDISVIDIGFEHSKFYSEGTYYAYTAWSSKRT